MQTPIKHSTSTEAKRALRGIVVVGGGVCVGFALPPTSEKTNPRSNGP